MNYKEELYHYGKLGMKWGQRRSAIKDLDKTVKTIKQKRPDPTWLSKEIDIQKGRARSMERIEKEGRQIEFTQSYINAGRKKAFKLLDNMDKKNISFDQAVKSMNRATVLKRVGVVLALIGGSYIVENMIN